MVDFIKRGTPVNFFVSPTGDLVNIGSWKRIYCKGDGSQSTFEVLWCSFVCIRVLVCWENFPDIVNCTSNIGKNRCRYMVNQRFMTQILYLHKVLHTYNYHFIFGKSVKVHAKYLFIKLSKSLKEKYSNIWEIYNIYFMKCR